MGDRGGTATQKLPRFNFSDYTRWEIGGEPQQKVREVPLLVIIPDGRSGGNRNVELGIGMGLGLYPMGDRGGTATVSERVPR